MDRTEWKQNGEKGMGNHMKRVRTLLCTVAALVSVSYAAGAQTKKPGKKPTTTDQNTTQAQGQLQGGDGVFKTIYTLNSGFNFTILSARYTVEPFIAYSGEIAGPDQKILVLTVAMKNANPVETFIAPVNFTVVDDKGHDYQGTNYHLTSYGVKELSLNFKPGQGYGQDPATDEMAVDVILPADAKITKLIANEGRKFVPGEKVVRYFIAGAATKDRDGAEGNPKNVIAPLPDFLRDPADSSGATPLTPAKGALGTFLPSGYGQVRLDGFTASTTDKVDATDPDDDKKYAVVTLTVKNIFGKDVSLFDLICGDGTPILKDMDGEKYTLPTDSNIRKAKADAVVDSGQMIPNGETYTVRYFYQIPKAAKIKTVTYGQPSGHHYILDVSSMN